MSESYAVQWTGLPAATDEKGVYHVTVAEESPLSETIPAVVEAIGETNSDEPELLYDVIDPSALNALFQPRSDGTSRSNGSVSFEYAGYEIVYETNRHLRLRPLSDDR